MTASTLPYGQLKTAAQWMAMGGEVFARALRMAKPLSVIVLDIDYFKTVNNTWGRAVGDEVLRGLKEILEHKLRKRDLVGRLGGDEFAIALLDTERDGALVAAERLRVEIASRAFPIFGPNGEEEGPLHVTVSLGVVDLESSSASLPEMLEKARQALQAAKENGHNRVEIYNPIEIR